MKPEPTWNPQTQTGELKQVKVTLKTTLKLWPVGARNFSDNTYEEAVQELLVHIIEDHGSKDTDGWYSLCNLFTIDVEEIDG